MYMSPELVLCRGHNTKADIYSLGTTIIHMQTGSPPWVRRYPRTAYPSYLYIVSSSSSTLPRTPTRLLAPLIRIKDFCRIIYSMYKILRWRLILVLSH